MVREIKSWTQEAPWVDLGWRAVSPEAHSLVSHCLEKLIFPNLPLQQKGPASLVGLKLAVEGLLGGLTALEGVNWGRRPIGVVSFKQEPVSHRQFHKVLTGLEKAGLIERKGGRYDRSEPGASGLDARVRLTETGRKLAEAHGITEGSTQHFWIQTRSESEGRGGGEA